MGYLGVITSSRDRSSPVGSVEIPRSVRFVDCLFTSAIISSTVIPVVVFTFTTVSVISSLPPFLTVMVVSSVLK